MVRSPVTSLPTPALLVDMHLLEGNIAQMQRLADAHGKKLRPHVKAHKIPEFAHMQLNAGAQGICVAKVSEAEVMFEAGITDIFIANQIIGEDKLARLAALAKKAQITVLVDSAAGLKRLENAVQSSNVQLQVMVEVETGDMRCGCDVQTAFQLAERIYAHPLLYLRGLETYGGNITQSQSVREMRDKAQKAVEILLHLKEQLEKADIPVQEVSVGGTPAVPVLCEMDGITEIRPGVYIFTDVASVFRAFSSLDHCALSVLTQVISKKSDRYIITDAGAKSLSYAKPGIVFGSDTHYGLVKGFSGAYISKLSEEHAELEFPNATRAWAVGDKLELLPAHTCPVINLFDRVYCCRDGVVEAVLPVAARGKVE